MKKLLFILPFLVLVACGDDAAENTEVDKAIELKTFDDKLSYSFGALEAQSLTESTDPIAGKLDKKMLLEGYKEGFKTGFSRNPDQQCNETLNKLFGEQGMDFDEKYLAEGSKCYGSGMGGMFYEKLEGVSEVGRINKELLFRGFKDGLAGKADALKDEEKLAVVEQFSQEIQQKMQAEQVTKLGEIEIAETEEWVKIKAIKGIVELEGGVCLQTLRKGSGASPTATDDVESSYILSNLAGEVLQNSADSGKHFKTNIGSGVIAGWTIGFQAMQKGGKYKLYIPARLGYGAESLVFEIELFDFGPAGTIAPPQQPRY
jgi:FKBP-type peptidyl-prolyl cis-trans isomerase